uniref:Uncharacterized protein n=1 Tax=viral metagenome TaxID=1070528 RepID=A0A6H2A229_9ZZZZ
MPVIKVGNKYKIGKKGKPIYKSKASAERAYKGYLWSKYGKGKK